MKKVMLVFGTRPEAVKMCPLVNELRGRPHMQTLVCVTGQHREMLDQVLSFFSVTPEYDLAIMRSGQTLFDITTAVLTRLRAILEKADPNVVLVQGDTTSAFAAALACFYLRIPVGHVEAGLRTYNMDAPYPEEFNRRAVDAISLYHFAPTEQAQQNLLHEGVEPERVFLTGNTAIDALRTTVRQDYYHPILDWASDSRLVLLTTHRRENIGAPLERMLRAIRRCVEEHPDVKLIYPTHRNPAVRRIAHDVLDGHARIRILEPLDVPDFHNIMARSCLLLTDSGGIQEEAPSLGIPVLVLREVSERPEGISAGTVRLAGTSEASVYRTFSCLLDDQTTYEAMRRAVNPYGDGYASRRIVDILENS